MVLTEIYVSSQTRFGTQKGAGLDLFFASLSTLLGRPDFFWNEFEVSYEKVKVPAEVQIAEPSQSQAKASKSSSSVRTLVLGNKRLTALLRAGLRLESSPWIVRGWLGAGLRSNQNILETNPGEFLLTESGPKQTLALEFGTNLGLAFKSFHSQFFVSSIHFPLTQQILRPEIVAEGKFLWNWGNSNLAKTSPSDSQYDWGGIAVGPTAGLKFYEINAKLEDGSMDAPATESTVFGRGYFLGLHIAWALP